MITQGVPGRYIIYRLYHSPESYSFCHTVIPSSFTVLPLFRVHSAILRIRVKTRQLKFSPVRHRKAAEKKHPGAKNKNCHLPHELRIIYCQADESLTEMKESFRGAEDEREDTAMKKVLGIVMVLMMAVGLMVPVFGSAESVAGRSAMYVWCANGKRLNVREEPSLNAEMLFRLENGTKVSILENCGNGWAKISSSGREGFVKTAFLQAKKPGGTFRPFSAKVYSPNGKRVNMRVGANINSDRIVQLEGSAAIRVIGATGDWYKVQWGNATGYMMKKFVRT